MPKKSEGGWSGIGMANSGIDPTYVYFLNDHPTQIPPSEILGPVVQNCPILGLSCQMSKIIKVNFDGAYLRSSSGHFFYKVYADDD